MAFKLPKKQTDFIQLIRRSKSDTNGWAKVSKQLRAFSEKTILEEPLLYEMKDVEGHLYIRLAPDGQVIARYL